MSKEHDYPPGIEFGDPESSDRPFAILVRCSVKARDGLGNPLGQHTEMSVMAANYHNRPDPEVFADEPPVIVSVVHPWGPVADRSTGKSLVMACLTVREARAIANGLIAAANMAENADG